MPKRVPPPRPLRVLVVSGAIVGALLFSYSTTQIYLRFAEPEQQAPMPGATASARPTSDDPSDGTGSQAAASTQVEIATEGTAQEDPPEAEPSQQAENGDAAPPPHRGDEDGPGGRPPAPLPQSGTETPEISYQKIVYDNSHFMGQLTITNTGGQPLDGWELRVGFDDAQVVSAWGTEWEATSDGFVARQPSWEEAIPPGRSATVNFTAEGSSHTPERCSLNGAACSL